MKTVKKKEKKIPIFEPFFQHWAAAASSKVLLRSALKKKISSFQEVMLCINNLFSFTKVNMGV
jgi:hypothetical protein